MSGLTALLFLLISAPLFSKPRGIHLSWNQRGIEATPGSMGVTWMDDFRAPAMVRFGTDSADLDRKVRVMPRYSDALELYVLKATLRNLRPGTSYFYKVGSDEGGWSPVYRFRTAPEPGSDAPFTVGVWSDTQNNKGNMRFEQSDTIVSRMAKYPLDFTLHTGDIVENGSVAESWKNFFTVAEPLNSRFPFMSVTGNHDVVNDTTSGFQRPFPVFYDLFNLPGDQLNYSYRYGNTHLIAINSGYAQGASKVGKVLFSPDSPEYRWLEKDLAAARKDPKVRWIIMYFHYPVYSYGFSHVQPWQDRLKPIIDRFMVDLVISGHRHVYERHAAVRGSRIFPLREKGLYEKPEGTVYVTSGSCGGSLQGLGGDKLPTMVFTPGEKIYTFGVMRINGNRLQFEVFDKKGQAIDQFEIRK